MTYHALIVEDHHLLRQGLRSIVSGLAGYQVVGEAGDGKEAVRIALLLKPDLILMDISMPGMSGIEAIIQVKRRLPDIRILALTGYDSEEYVREALLAGVDGYALKDASYEEIINAIHMVAKGKKFICPEVSIHLVDNYLHHNGATPNSKPWSKLTARERSVFKLIAEGRTNRMVGEFLNISTKTVEKHRASMVHKLGLKNKTQLILAALEMGLIEQPDKHNQASNGLKTGPALPAGASSERLSVTSLQTRHSEYHIG